MAVTVVRRDAPHERIIISTVTVFNHGKRGHSTAPSFSIHPAYSMILVIKHIAVEGPGTIGTFFEKEGFQLREINLCDGDALPDNLSEIEAVICMGGPMNVYEEDEYPYLKDENLFIQRILKEEIPFFGICLGSQLLAKACGAKVTKAPKKEIGWFSVSLTKDGKNDPLFRGLNEHFEVFQWHGDTFEIPKQGRHLALSKGCNNQALKAGSCAYGLQFHIEVTDDIIKNWAKADFSNSDGSLKREAKEMINRYPKVKQKFNNDAEIIYRNFLKIIQKKAVAV